MFAARNCFLRVPAYKADSRSWKFQNRWYEEFNWLHYDATLQKILCFVCVEANSRGLFSNAVRKEEAFTTLGFENWRNAIQRFRKHELSQQHGAAVDKLSNMKNLAIDKTLGAATLKKQSEARTALRAIFSSIIYLAKQGLAFRGSDNNGGNFKELLNLRSCDIDELKCWLRREKTDGLGHSK